MPDTDQPDLDPKALKALTRDELDKAAAEAGVPDPEALPNKGAVIDALPNPALAPAADPDAEPRDREYLVSGPQAVLGHQPGEQFTATIPAGQEAFLTEVGHLRRVNPEGKE